MKSLQPKTIGVRELRQQFKKIAYAAKHGASFVVTAHRKPIFRIEPPIQDKKSVGQSLLDDFKMIQFHSGEKDLSKRIDEIVYDDRR